MAEAFSFLHSVLWKELDKMTCLMGFAAFMTHKLTRCMRQLIVAVMSETTALHCQ